MATLYQSDFAKGVKTVPISDDADVLSQRGYVVPTAALAAADIAELLILPADHVVVDVSIDTDQLDSNGTPTLTLDVGIFSGTGGVNDATRTCGNEFAAALTTGQAGGFARMAKMQGIRSLPVSTKARGIGVKAAAGAATGVVPLTSLNVNRGQWQASTVYAQNDYIYLRNGVRAKCTTAGTSGATDPFTGSILYNATVTDNTATWTIADPVLALTMLYRAAHYAQ